MKSCINFIRGSSEGQSGLKKRSYVKEMDVDLTIIIVNWNTRDMLRDCLDSIEKNTENQKVNIIVVDNASKDGSREMVASLFPKVKLINSGGNIGFAKANNLAIPYAETPLILFLNPDTLVMQNSLRGMVDFTRNNPSVGALGCKMKHPDGRVQELLLQWYLSPCRVFLTMLLVSGKASYVMRKFLPYKDPNKSGYIIKLAGGCLMVRSEVLKQVGCFDDRFFMYGEDGDLCYRIVKGGWKIFYLSEYEIIHLIGGASNNSGNDFSTLMMCESIHKLMGKYYGKYGQISYRAAVCAVAHLRLLVLAVLKTLTLFFSIVDGFNYQKSTHKYINMIKWSFGLRHPVIKE
jgi:GT2 family glycosyltransferase